MTNTDVKNIFFIMSKAKLYNLSKWYIILFCTINIGVGTSKGQNLDFSIPEIENYTRFDYKGGTQTWDIISTYNNRITAANNEGLLIFDGHKWEKYNLPNKTILRSIAFDPSTQKIYAGGQDEIGYFQADKNGILKFTDLKSTIPESFRQLEDVWNITFSNKTLYFRSLNKIFAYDGNQWKVFSTKESTQMTLINQTIVYNDTEKGLFMISDGNSVFIKGSEILKNKTITNIIDLKDQWFVLSEKDGIFKYSNDEWQALSSTENTYLKTNRVHSACKLNDTLMAIGTYLKGIVIMDIFGKHIRTITKDEGLQNNTISSLHFSANHQLWAGTYNGIDMIDLGNTFTNIFPDGDLQGTVYATVIYDNKLYCGTENGLYYKELSDKLSKQFQLVKNTAGQVWGLDVALGDLIMSHNDGAFVIKKDIAQKISKYNGSWKFLTFEDGQFCIAGSYNGLHVFRKINNIWLNTGKISGFDESCRIMVKDGKNIWVSHPYRGLFKIDVNIEKLSANIENFGQKNGLPGNLRNTVYNIDNHIIVTGEQGLYKYNPDKNIFFPYNLPGIPTENNAAIKTMELSENKLWFATEHHLGSIQYTERFFQSKNYKTQIIKLNNNLVPGFEKIFPLQSNEALLLTTKGLKYFKKSEAAEKKLEAYISKITDINNQSLITEGFGSTLGTATDYMPLNHTSNALVFDFASNECTKNVRYRYYLHPVQKDWSPWEHKSQKEFNNLPPGKYELKLEASDMFGNTSPTHVYTFVISAPWYKSKAAKFLYFLGIILLILYSRRRLVKKYEQITTDLEEQKNESEALVLQLQKEKLEAEILFKNKELGLSSMHLVQKNEAISRLKTELSKFIKKISDPEIKKEIKNMISILSDDERLEDDWESFAQNFDSVHNEFITKLKLKFPQLTPSDLKLCAYLKLNLTTKEIAPLLNISVRGVEISRYRLRKKLDIGNEVNLNDFMMHF
jgi:hypothetical protein